MIETNAVVSCCTILSKDMKIHCICQVILPGSLMQESYECHGELIITSYSNLDFLMIILKVNDSPPRGICCHW